MILFSNYFVNSFTHLPFLCTYVYIHISVAYTHIQGYCGQRNFIAAQTPMKNTEGDVWEMIWMGKCAAVVVLCDFVEGKDVSRQTTFKHSVQLPSIHE